MMSSSSVKKHAFIASLAVSGSRVAGLVREVVFAFFFGAHPAFDAFTAAFRIPNLLRDLCAEGALSNAFVTVFSKKDPEKESEAAWRLTNQIFSLIIVIIGLIVMLGIFFSPQIVSLVAAGFEGEKFKLTVWLNQILFPFILFVSLSAIAMGALNAREHFALPQSASTFFNITSVATGLGLAYLLAPHVIIAPLNHWLHGTALPPLSWEESTRAITGMALGTLLGGLVQWLVQMPSLMKMGYRFRFLPFWKDESVKQVLRLTLPAMIGGAAVQINVLINSHFASYLNDGSLSWLNYSFRLMQFPIGIFGVAIASATTPAIARLLSAGQEDDLKNTLKHSSHMALFLCLPSALGLIALAHPIISLIYEHGQFKSYDTLQAAHALQAYALGLVFYAFIKIYQPVFLAYNDARTPMIISLISIGINFLLNFIFVFVFHLHHWGLALGTSLVALWNAAMLLWFLRKKIPNLFDTYSLKQLLKITFASTLSVLAGWNMYRGLFLALHSNHLLARLTLVMAPIGTSVLFYYFCCSRLEVDEVKWMKNVFSSWRSRSK